VADDELTIGPLHFEYDPKTRYLGIGNGDELYGTAEVSPEDWAGFRDAAKELKEDEKRATQG
jgi:hypothetical protein